DDRIIEFYRGNVAELTLIPAIPFGLETDGLDVDESRILGVAWTNGHAVIRIPNNPNAPATNLDLTIGPEHARRNHIVLSINGQRALDEVIQTQVDVLGWRKRVELPPIVREEPWLDIVIDSDTFKLSDERPIAGARLYHLSLKRED